MMERIDAFHKTPEENIIILYNMIQSCRTDLSILKYRNDCRPLLEKDTELHKIVEALAREMKEVK